MFNFKAKAMGKIISVTCPTCGGRGKVDDYYDGEKMEWVERFCSACSGSGYITAYQNDDGTYSGWW